MPYKDPEEHRQHAREYRKKLIEGGYGKALYARRKQHYKNEARLRGGVQEALRFLDARNTRKARQALESALEDAPNINKKPMEELGDILGLDAPPKFKAKDGEVV